MSDDLEHRILLIRKNQQSFTRDEQATRQGAVLPLLGRLGWDRDNIDEVKPEYGVGDRKVDYALLKDGRPLVFLEVGRAGEDLQQYQGALLDCALNAGVKLVAITNGIMWWLCMPMPSGSGDQRPVLVIDIGSHDAKDIAARLREFLNKDAVVSGSALAAAQRAHESKSRDAVIREAIPKAWQWLCQSPEEPMLALFAERVERLCGHRPSHATLAEHLSRISGSPAKDSPVAPATAAAPKPSAKAAPAPAANGDRWTFRRPLSFRLLDEHRDATTFKQVLLGVGEILYRKHGEEFWTRVSAVRSSRGKTFFAKDSREYLGMIEPAQIGESGIYVETGSSAEDIRARCLDILRLFGHEPGKLHVTFRDAVE